MAENLGQIDVVVKSDNQQIRMPAAAANVGAMGQDPSFIGPPKPASLAGGGAAQTAITATYMANVLAKFGKVAKILGPIAIAVGVALAAVVVVTKVINTAIQSLVKWDRQIQGLIGKFAVLNGNAAMAAAIQKLGDFQRSLREARAIGPMLLQMARARESFMKARSAVMSAFNAIKITVLEAFFRVAEAIIQPLVDSAGGIEGLTRAARICTIALIELANLATKPIGWLAKIVGFFAGGAGGAILGFTGDAILTITDKLDEAVDAIKKQTQDAATREDMKAIVEANSLPLAHLEHMTGGLWRHGTQVPLQAATGREINPRQWAAREAAKKQRRSL